MPGPPFVDDQLHAAAPIDLAHHRPVAADQRVQAVGFVEQLVPLVVREPDRVAFAGIPIRRRASADVPRIVMQRPAPEIAEAPFALLDERREKPSRPAEIAAVRSRADECRPRAVLRNPRGVTAVFGRVLLRGEVAAAAPGFVADAPETDTKRLAIAALRA